MSAGSADGNDMANIAKENKVAISNEQDAEVLLDNIFSSLDNNAKFTKISTSKVKDDSGNETIARAVDTPVVSDSNEESLQLEQGDLNNNNAKFTKISTSKVKDDSGNETIARAVDTPLVSDVDNEESLQFEQGGFDDNEDNLTDNESSEDKSLSYGFALPKKIFTGGGKKSRMFRHEIEMDALISHNNAVHNEMIKSSNLSRLKSGIDRQYNTKEVNDLKQEGLFYNKEGSLGLNILGKEHDNSLHNNNVANTNTLKEKSGESVDVVSANNSSPLVNKIDAQTVKAVKSKIPNKITADSNKESYKSSAVKSNSSINSHKLHNITKDVEIAEDDHDLNMDDVKLNVLHPDHLAVENNFSREITYKLSTGDFTSIAFIPDDRLPALVKDSNGNMINPVLVPRKLYNSLFSVNYK
ncbi:hypothetical protein CAXC1_220027 [Candidatus Xenohaliotis californiensis]|uniref:Uncharacterized protein n=1 Tax=Candidatus Xenohaliotis californiensis TaxID=84677 RepID=A0ABP0EUR9_9RICK|nr:hypothetical protein CAXC1_220027 [Candidatus Xenohaliotis californiensis]